jgi:hypothetical protein
VTLYRAERDAEARMDIEISRTAMATAYHQAAHAVMAWKLGVAVKRVTIVPSKDAKGHCYHAQVVRGECAEVDSSDRGRMEREQHIMIALAGPVAQRIYNPRGYRRGHGRGDQAIAADLALNMNGSSRATDAYLKWLTIHTRDCLENVSTWPLVEALAAELVRRRTIEGAEVVELLRKESETAPVRFLQAHGGD